jgi:hypothetical protein
MDHRHVRVATVTSNLLMASEGSLDLFCCITLLSIIAVSRTAQKKTVSDSYFGQEG